MVPLLWPKQQAAVFLADATPTPSGYPKKPKLFEPLEKLKFLALPVGEANYVTQYHDVKRLLGFLRSDPKLRSDLLC